MEEYVKHYQVGLIVSIFATLGAVACASASGGKAHSCELEPADSAFAAGKTVYRECAVDSKVKLLSTGPHPDWQAPNGRTGCFIVGLEFVVDTAGRPERENVKVTHSNDRALADAIVAILPQFKYEAAVKNGAHVRQIVAYETKVAVMKVIVPQGTAPVPPSRSSGQRPPGC